MGDLDVDGDKYLDVKELTTWVHPKNFQAVSYFTNKNITNLIKKFIVIMILFNRLLCHTVFTGKIGSCTSHGYFGRGQE